MKTPLKLCFIDDDTIYQYTVLRSIKTHQLADDVLLFSDGERAIEYLTGNTGDMTTLPDIIFLDIDMPIMDGWQFLEEYVKWKYAIEKEIALYMITSSLDPIDKKHSEEISEIVDYIIKPVNPDRLKEIVDDVLRKRVHN